MPTDYRQGESWRQALLLAHHNTPLIVGPAAQAATLVHSIEVLLLVSGRVQAMYRYPASANLTEFEAISFDATDPSTIHLTITRALSRHFEVGYLYAAVLVRLQDPLFSTGRAVECVLPIGYLLRGDTAAL